MLEVAVSRPPPARRVSLRAAAFAASLSLVASAWPGDGDEPSSSRSAPGAEAEEGSGNALESEQLRILRVLNGWLKRPGAPIHLPFTAYSSEFRWTVDEYAIDSDRGVLTVRYRYAINPERLGGVVFAYEADIDLSQAARAVSRRMEISLVIDPDLAMPPVVTIECAVGAQCYRERILRRCDGFGSRCEDFRRQQNLRRGFAGYWPVSENDPEERSGRYWLQRLIDLNRGQAPRSRS